MRIFIFPGSFDPFSLGHLDIARRAAKLCDRLVVAIMCNSVKTPLFSIEERLLMVQTSLQDIEGVEVIVYDGLLVDLYREIKAVAVVRGLRSESDFRNEAEMAAANKLLLKEYDVLLLPCSADLAFTSSSIIKEVAFYGGDISKMVSKDIIMMIESKFDQKKGESDGGK